MSKPRSKWIMWLIMCLVANTSLLLVQPSSLRHIPWLSSTITGTSIGTVVSSDGTTNNEEISTTATTIRRILKENLEEGRETDDELPAQGIKHASSVRSNMPKSRSRPYETTNKEKIKNICFPRTIWKSVPRSQVDTQRWCRFNPPNGSCNWFLKKSSRTSNNNSDEDTTNNSGRDTTFLESLLPSSCRPVVHKISSIPMKSLHLVSNNANNDDDKNNKCGPSFVDPQQCRIGFYSSSSSSQTSNNDKKEQEWHDGTTNKKKNKISSAARILFIGHSHTRYMASLYCMMLRSKGCALYAKHLRNITTTLEAELYSTTTIIPTTNSEHLPDDSTTLIDSSQLQEKKVAAIVFVQANYDARFKVQMLRQYLQQKLSYSPEDVKHAFTQIVVSRGSWDTLFFDNRMSVVAAEFEEGLVSLREQHPTAKIVVHLPHYCHAKIPSVKSLRPSSQGRVTRAKWRAACFTPARITRMRLANLCGIQQFLQRQQQGVKDKFHVIQQEHYGIEVFDTWQETQHAVAFSFTDGLGHHYVDAALEGLTMKLLTEHICPTTFVTEEHHSAKLWLEVAESCELMRIKDEHFEVDPMCACHRDEYADTPFCKSLGRFLPNKDERN